MVDERTYSYDELAARIEEVLGVRPSTSALRAAAATARRTPSTQSRPRLTAGMPAPQVSAHRTAPARFSVDDIEQWLDEHPRRRWNRAVEEFGRALRDEAVPTEHAVALARRAGLSWSQITQALRTERGDRRVRAAVYKAYRHLDSQ